MTFYRALLPPCFSPGTEAYPVWPVDIVRSASGSPIRRARRSEAYREFNVTFDVRRRNDIHDILSHYTVMGGSLHSFPMRDKFDFKSCKPDQTPTAADCLIGTGDGVTDAFQLKKPYSVTLTDATTLSFDRTIKVIKENSLLVAVGGVAQVENTDFVCDYDTGIITFQAGHIPAGGSPAPEITAGFEFYVPVCYGPSNPVQTLAGITAGSVASITLYEVDP